MRGVIIMEQNKETDELRVNGAFVILSTLAIGYIVGRLSVNQVAVEAYRRGVSDTLNSLVFTNR